MKTGFLVGDAMTKKPITIEGSLTVEECARIMAERHVGSLIIMDGENAQGIVTEQDFVRKIIAKGKNPRDVQVSDLMARELLTIAPDADIFDALVIMNENNIRHLPVLYGNEMVGFLTLKDILKVEPQLFEIMVDRFELREESRKPVSQFSPKIGECDACGAFTKGLRRDGSSRVCEHCWPEEPPLREI